MLSSKRGVSSRVSYQMEEAHIGLKSIGNGEDIQEVRAEG